MFSKHSWIKKNIIKKFSSDICKDILAAGTGMLVLLLLLLLFPVCLWTTSEVFGHYKNRRWEMMQERKDWTFTCMNTFTSLSKSIELEEKECERLVIKDFPN